MTITVHRIQFRLSELDGEETIYITGVPVKREFSYSLHRLLFFVHITEIHVRISRYNGRNFS